MIVGVGIDMIEIQRVGEKLSRGSGFREKVFSPDEVTFCEAAASPAQHYAARFAAKEAFLKATGEGLLLGHELHLIEVGQDETGKPALHLKGSFRDLAAVRNWHRIHLSISHTKETACAVVIIES